MSAHGSPTAGCGFGVRRDLDQLAGAMLSSSNLEQNDHRSHSWSRTKASTEERENLGQPTDLMRNGGMLTGYSDFYFFHALIPSELF